MAGVVEGWKPKVGLEGVVEVVDWPNAGCDGVRADGSAGLAGLPNKELLVVGRG